MKAIVKDHVLTLYFEGSITSANAESTGQEVESIVSSGQYDNIVLDMNALDFISSAGLRIVFHLKKLFPRIEIINVSLDVFDILQMTGFTQLAKVSRKMAEIDITGMEVIGEGRTGIVYRMNKDTILKVYKRDVSVADIEREMSMCREAFVLGIPTALTFDIVRVGDRLASRFEMLDCDTLAAMIGKDLEHLDDYLDAYAALLKTINMTSSDQLELPDKKKKWLGHAELCLPHLDKEHGEKLVSLIKGIPEAKTFIHGDCHIKNIMSDGKNLFLIDLGSLSKGYPIFDLAALYRTFFGFDFTDPGNTERFLELPRDILDKIFYGLMERYFGFVNDEIMDKLAVVGLCYLVSWSSRYENNPARIEDGAKRLAEVLDRVETLVLPLQEKK